MDKINVINTKNIIAFIIALTLIAMAIYSVDILMILFGSFVITCAVDPLIYNLQKYMPRGVAVLIVLLLLLIGAILIFVPLISVSIDEITDLIDAFPPIIDNIDKFLDFKIFNQSVSSMITFESIKDPIATGAKSIIENSIMATKQVASIFTTIFAMAIVVFYMAMDKDRLVDKFIEFFPQQQKETARKILENISSKVGNYIFAQGLAMVFVGLVTMIGLFIIGNNHAFLLGFITCILDIIPVVGPAIATIIGVVSGISGGFVNILLILVVYLVAQWAQNQLLKPVLFGKMLNMHPLLIIVALLLSARFLGFWGLILSPALASVICVLVDELYLNRINSK